MTKKAKAGLTLAAALVLCAVCALAGRAVFSPRESRSFTEKISVPDGMSLHVDTSLRRGTVRFLVTNEAQSTVADMELTHSYSYAVQAFSDDEFSVSVTLERASADVEIYVTDATGKRVQPKEASAE